MAAPHHTQAQRRFAEQADSRAAAAIRRSTERAVKHYRRSRVLPGLIYPFPHLGDIDAKPAAEIIERLERAIAAEERRAAGGVGTGICPYDTNRHLALLEALAAERAMAAERKAA